MGSRSYRELKWYNQCFDTFRREIEINELLKEAATLKFVGTKPSKWGPDTLKSSEWPFIGLRGSLHIPTRYSGPQGSKLLGKSTPKMG